MAGCRFLARAVLLLIAMTGIAPGQQAEKKQIGENEKLRFEQDKVAAHMRELEDRMIRLAELLRDAEPDDSARLLLSVENAREQLILEQMQAISDMLAGIDLSRATDEQKQVLEKLNRLKELLLNADLDLRIRLEQIKKIDEARQRLAELVAQEEDQKTATRSADQKGQPTDPLVKNEQRNQRAGEDIQQQVNRIAGAGKAAGSIGGACQSMGKAANSLGQSQCSAASENQQAAIDQLKEADKQLEELKQQLQQQVESAARQRVTELLVEMIERQTDVKESTEQAAVRVAQQDSQVTAILEGLATIEGQIMGAADECIEVCELSEFSFVLPEALRDIRIAMNGVRSELEQAHADDRLVGLENQIVRDLTELLDAMKQADKPGSPKLANAKLGCCSDRNKLLAEVKMLYWMQTTLNRKTKEVRARELAQELVGEQLKQESLEMKRQQDKIHQVTDRLRELTNPGFVNGDSFP
jgi:hypothetical protein